MTKSLIVSLGLLFILTLFGGILTENQTKIIREAGDEILKEIESEEIEKEVVSEKGRDTIQEVSVADYVSTTYEVVRVIDGDTVIIEKLGVKETIRMIGVDTPETVHPSKPVQCFGQEASQKTKEWLEGRRVYLEIDETQGERDKYGRLLVYVYRADGLFVNYELIKQGYAYEYTYNLPYKYQTEFKLAEKNAKAISAGFWSSATCQ